MKEQKLFDIADIIPDMGRGGKWNKNELVHFASLVEQPNAIVEAGPWLGSSTAYITIGTVLNNTNYLAPIHSYDPWHIDLVFKQKAEKECGEVFELGQDIQPVWRKNIYRLGGNNISHKMSVYDASWDDTPIGMFVDDISTSKSDLDTIMAIFGHAFIDGMPYFCMDYAFYETHDDQIFHETPKWFKDHPEFEKVARVPAPAKTVIFRYRKPS